MNMAEAAQMRAVIAELDALKNRVKDLERRVDDFSTAERARETLKLKKAQQVG